MGKDELLKTIAETGYNIGFGARKTFATLDIAEKGPGWIGLISFALGTFALFVDELSAKIPSAILLIAGVASLYMGFYRASDYEPTAKHLLRLQNKLRDLYRSVKDGANLTQSQDELQLIEQEFHSITVSKQIFLSDWYAHYKFFAQTQIGWMDEQLDFKFWRDMIPLSAKIVIISLMVGLLAAFAHYLVKNNFSLMC
jgi:hypothetical protein